MRQEIQLRLLGTDLKSKFNRNKNSEQYNSLKQNFAPEYQYRVSLASIKLNTKRPPEEKGKGNKVSSADAKDLIKQGRVKVTGSIRENWCARKFKGYATPRFKDMSEEQKKARIAKLWAKLRNAVVLQGMTRRFKRARGNEHEMFLEKILKSKDRFVDSDDDD